MPTTTNRFTTYSLKQLKAYATTHNIVITGDRRKKSSYVESINHHHLHNGEPAITTVKFTYEPTVSEEYTSEIDNPGDNWLSEVYEAPLEPDQDITIEELENQDLPWEEPVEPTPINPIIIPFLLPFLLIGLTVVGVGKLITLLIGLVISKVRQAPQKAPRPSNIYTKSYNKIVLRPA